MPRRLTSLAAATAVAAAVLAAPLVSTTASAAPARTGTATADAATGTPGQTPTGVIAYSTKNALYVTTAATGHTPRKVASEPTGDYIENVYLSADGSRIMYTAVQMKDKDTIASRQEVVVDRKDGKQVYRSGHYTGSDNVHDRPGLSPDGRKILVGDTSGKKTWFYDIDTKKTAGTRALQSGEWPLGVAPDGRAYLVHGVDVIAVDLSTGKRTTVLDRDDTVTQGRAFDIGGDGSISFWSAKECGTAMTSHVADVTKGTGRAFGHSATDDGITSPNSTQLLLTRAAKARTSTCFGGDGAPAQQKVTLADLKGDNGRTLFTGASFDWQAAK